MSLVFRNTEIDINILQSTFKIYIKIVSNDSLFDPCFNIRCKSSYRTGSPNKMLSSLLGNVDIMLLVAM